MTQIVTAPKFLLKLKVIVPSCGINVLVALIMEWDVGDETTKRSIKMIWWRKESVEEAFN